MFTINLSHQDLKCVKLKISSVYTCVDAHMDFECSVSEKGFATNFALVRSVTRVRTNVIGQRVFVGETAFTYRTWKSSIFGRFYWWIFRTSSTTESNVMVLLIENKC